MRFKLHNADIISWAQEYEGEKFHALLCDPPYHLTSIVKRFGKDGSAPAKFGTDGAFSRASKGFMGQTWDGGDIAFRPETWAVMKDLLYPGAFGMAFASSRGFHRMAVAIEDAGFIIHPMLGWVYGSGFPKATRIDTQIDKMNGKLEERIIGTQGGTGYTKLNVEQGAQNRLTTEFNKYGKAITSVAKAWEGHKYGLQALKPALEPIIVFQKPYEGRSIDNMLETGAGALNIDAGRIGNSGSETHSSAPSGGIIYGKYGATESEVRNCGRFPSNFLLTHHHDCKLVGMKPAESYTINRWEDDMHPFGNGAGNEFESTEVDAGMEEIWECVDDCPIKALNEQSGTVRSGSVKPHKQNLKSSIVFQSNKEITPTFIADAPGGASRFFSKTDWELENQDPFIYCQKSNKKERNAGVSEACTHPTVKPIKLNTYLAKLLLPPDIYTPRRLLVPFSGVASEMIGAILAGWDEVEGVELTKEYIPIALQRLEYWEQQVLNGLKT